MANFKILDVNPNDEVGGGGCLCSEEKREDGTGPYAIFPHTSTDSNISPHVVLCAPCARAVVHAIDTPPEPIDVEVVDVEDDDVPVV